jgi:hypothetical protein
MAVAVMALVGPLLSSVPAHAAVPIIFVQPDNRTRVYGHQCKSLGTDGIGNEAVACSDLAVRGTTSQTEVWAVNQIICHRAKVIFACEGASTTAKGGLWRHPLGLRNSAGSTTTAARSVARGVPVAGSSRAATTMWTTNGCYEMWGVAIENLVQTRSGVVVQGPNVASAHYLVCPA